MLDPVRPARRRATALPRVKVVGLPDLELAPLQEVPAVQKVLVLLLREAARPREVPRVAAAHADVQL